MRQLEEPIRELERLLGRETLDVEILKEALFKKAVGLVVARSVRFPMKAAANTLEVACSNLVEQAKPGG